MLRVAGVDELKVKHQIQNKYKFREYQDNTMPNKANQIVPPGNNETLKVMFDVMHFL